MSQSIAGRHSSAIIPDTTMSSWSSMCRTISVRAAALAVPGGDEIVPVGKPARRAGSRHVILTQDWHPPGHSSFASAHPGQFAFRGGRDGLRARKSCGRTIACRGRRGAAFHPGLDLPRAELVLRKGFHPAIDLYSAFRENDRKTPTGLAAYLRERGIGRVTLCGLATDFCVLDSALDARHAGFATRVVLDACRGLDVDGSLARAIEEMRQAEVELL